MKFLLRAQEYKLVVYRILLAYVFYFIARVLFYFYNADLLHVDSISSFFKISYYGLTFDTSAILYVNALFILLSIVPFFINTRQWYQKMLMLVYFTTNLLAYATNFIDFIYYKYNFSRTTLSIYNATKNEKNQSTLLVSFIYHYWHVFVLFFLVSFLWYWLYKKVSIPFIKNTVHPLKYISISILMLLMIATLMVGAIRGGDFKKSTRPINMVDANRYVSKPEHADLVLNTPFALIRTARVNSFKKKNFGISEKKIDTLFRPLKAFHNLEKSRPNIVLFIVESYGKEYLGAFNKNTSIKEFKSYTPFIDSLAQHSLIFTNAFANGYKSIHGMSSVLAGIPSFHDAFTSSVYAKQKIQSLVSCLKEEGYDTSFFHGASNGSMGFLGFGNILGIDHYYGREAYNNENNFDGFWGIWDEPFMQFMKKELDTKKQPFFSTIFTLSSHEPYIVPKAYENVFPKGKLPIHQCVGYTDHAFKKFFEAAKKEPWFENTIFVITADHSNQIQYKEYSKVMNRNTVPILFYKPNNSLAGSSNNLAQQIDIYPTILNMIGYDKPFRSWGRSLVNDTLVKPFAINYSGLQYQMQRGNYICTFDGNKTLGIFDIHDKSLKHNLINNKNKEMLEVELACKAFLQDYYSKIIDKKLY